MAPRASTSAGEKLALPAFITLLTKTIGLSTSEALGCASGLIKSGYNRSGGNVFKDVTEANLVAAGVTDFETRKVLMGYGRTGKGKTKVEDLGDGVYRRKRTKDSDLDDPLPKELQKKQAISLEFNEIPEDYLLQDRSLLINRAPVMTAWATVVAERLGFTRQESLSLAHTYTNMNATSKGVSLGIYSPEKGKERTAIGPSQPYVEIMGRQIPVLSLQTGEWRGIANGAIAEPEQAFGYIQRSFRQHMSAAMGALRLLAESYDPDDLNKAGYELYCEFRPEVKGWGEKASLQLGKILDLRQKPKDEEVEDEKEAVDTSATVDEPVTAKGEEPEESAATSAVPETTGIGLGEPEEEVKPSKRQLSEVAEQQPSSAKKSKLFSEVEEDVKPKIAVKREPSEEDGGVSDSDLAALDL